MAKELDFEGPARERLQTGVDQLTDAVAVTLGPKGRTVVLERQGRSPEVTKDGVTVAKEIELEDRTENMAVEMVKEVAQNTADEAGDGTTTATVLAHAIFSEGLKNVASGVNPMGLKRGIDAGTAAVVARLRELATETVSREDIEQVATISANGDVEIGAIIAEAMEIAGRDGAITVEEGRSLDTELEAVEGMRFDEGYLSPHFVNVDERREVILEDALVLVTDEGISAMNELLPILEKVKEAGKPLLIIADGVEDEALATLAVNAVKGTLQVCAVEAPGFGDRQQRNLEDIAALTGAALVSADLGRELERTALEDLGGAGRIVVDENTTTIVRGGGAKQEIDARISEIRAEIERTESDYSREKLEERLARLAGGVAVIRVGAATETEMKEKTARTRDALAATRAAVEEGVLPGGGVALLRARPALDDVETATDAEAAGVRILRRALVEPTRRIAGNAGAEGSLVVERILEDGDGVGMAFGYDAQEEEFTDLLEAGILDPTKVVRTALQNAASVASLLLTTESTVADVPEPEPEGEGGGPGGPGGPGGAPGGMPGGGMPGGGMPGGMGGGMPGMGGGGLPGM